MDSVWNFTLALLWLQQNNKLYQDIVVDENQLLTLPEDGIPAHNLTTLYQITWFPERKQCTTWYGFMGPPEPVNTIPNVDLLVAWSMTGILVAGTTGTVVCWVYIMPGQ